MNTITDDRAELTDAQFNRISALVKGICGINLHDGKRELVKARLSKRLHQLRMRDFDDYLEYLRQDGGTTELTAMLDLISTNLTHFFREGQHFEFLRQTVLPELLCRNRDEARIRIWSAGCSSGEEPYSLAILLSQVPDLRCWDVKILATDISTRMLARAQEGHFEADRLRETPQQVISSHFTLVRSQPRKVYAVSPRLGEMISFARLNLMEPWPMRGRFDVIFCRNVMIYFDKATQNRLVQRFSDILTPGGLLFVGHSESLSGIEHSLRYVLPAVYQKA